ncbi:MAG: exodeoxyribonuclease VII large subunit [Patescibacteria group bacterium]
MIIEEVFSVTDFVAVFNQTLEYAYPSVSIAGELANFRVSKGKWVYFDLKDDYSIVKFFGTVYQMPGPLEDGLIVEVRGAPRLHTQFGFSITVHSLRPVGEGSIQKAANLLEAQLAKEGLFVPERKRALTTPPQSIGLITSGESAAYYDFIKVINARWGGVDIKFADVQVQGEPAVGQVVRAIDYFNAHAQVDVLVITRGGGSADDLAVFSSEQVTRAVAGSRTPTMVAIGHEVDVSLAELAADLRASTPSNAAELIVPDRGQMAKMLSDLRNALQFDVSSQITKVQQDLVFVGSGLALLIDNTMKLATQKLLVIRELVQAYNPIAILGRGYAVVRVSNKVVSSVQTLKRGQAIEVQLADGKISGDITAVEN